MLYLARHGQTAYNSERRLQGQRDIPLSEEGVRQAEALAERLFCGGFRFDRLCCSRLSRARDTARVIGERLGLEPTVLGGVEEICLGCFQGHTFDECAKLYPEAFADYLERPGASNAHGGENGRQVMERARAAILKLPEAENGSALIVCHGAVIGYLRAAVLGVPLNNVSELIPANAEIAVFDREAIENLRNYR